MLGGLGSHVCPITSKDEGRKHARVCIERSWIARPGVAVAVDSSTKDVPTTRAAMNSK